MRETFGHTEERGEGVWIVPDHLAAGTISLIRRDLPAPCQAYTGNACVDAALLGVRYVGTPERSGYWIDVAHWDAAQAVWMAATAAEDAAAAVHAGYDRPRTRAGQLKFVGPRPSQQEPGVA